jgi:hypothetical protein
MVMRTFVIAISEYPRHSIGFAIGWGLVIAFVILVIWLNRRRK